MCPCIIAGRLASAVERVGRWRIAERPVDIQVSCEYIE